MGDPYAELENKVVCMLQVYIVIMDNWGQDQVLINLPIDFCTREVSFFLRPHVPKCFIANLRDIRYSWVY